MNLINQNLIQELVQILEKRMNIYISCDKNILFLLLKLVKICNGISSTIQGEKSLSKPRYKLQEISSVNSSIN